MIRFYQILVDSVTVGSPLRVFDPPQGTLRTLLKSPLAVSDIMHVRFYGGIGPNLCHGFSHIDTTRIDLVGYKVSLWGKQNLRSPVCPGIVSELYPEWNRDHILEFYPPLRVGTWIFLVSQPDGSVLRKEGRSPMIMNAKNFPGIFRFLLCFSVIYSMLAWCSDIAASDNARRPYVPLTRTACRSSIDTRRSSPGDTDGCSPWIHGLSGRQDPGGVA